AVLPPNLPPSNPLDCAGAVNDDFATVFRRGLEVLGDAPEVACLGFEFDARDDFSYDPGLLDLGHDLPNVTAKPCFVYSSFSNTRNRDLADKLMDTGVPVLNGLDETLSAIEALRKLRARKAMLRVDDPPPAAPARDVVEKWRKKLDSGAQPGEAGGLAMLEDFGIPAVSFARCDGWSAVGAAADRLGYPVVLKTAASGIAHKSDVGGVSVNILDKQVLHEAYDAIAARHGPKMLVQSMAPAGVDIAFGSVVDPDFGPLVMVSAGGTLSELFDDRQTALAPFGKRRAEKMVRSLKLFPVLTGARGAPPCDLDALTGALTAFSVMAATLAAQMAECDVNPLIVGETGLIAVDALPVPGNAGNSVEPVEWPRRDPV
ncbi:MAG: acetate--CoA ligase family protein, partial [Hyphomicrobiaceae bacterium]